MESLAEFDMIATVAADIGRPAPIVFRTNPDVDAQTHPYISTGLQEHKFGISLSEAEELCRQSRKIKEIVVVGVGCHIGSQIIELGPFEQALDSITNFAAGLIDDGFELKYLDFGGGLGISYEGDLIDLAIKAGIIVKTGSWFSFEENQIGQGREKVKTVLQEDKKLKKKIENQVKAYLGL